MPRSKQKLAAVANPHVPADRYLSALLSQALVAFTVEFDNEFERRMLRAGYPGALLSLVVWSNLMRFLTAGDLCVSELAARALATENQIKFELGCLERWRFVVLRPDSADDRPIPQRIHGRAGRILRDGWGSGRGIRSQWLVRLTEKARKATEIWPSLFGDIEQRWAARFGAHQLESLRQALGAVVKQLDLDLPQALPGYGNADYPYPKLQTPRTGVDPLPVLLSQLLLAFTIDFDRESRVPLRLCANTLRVLGQTPVPLGEIPRLTGGSPETSDIGWEAKPYVAIEPDPTARRGKVARLTPLGLRAQRNYHELVREIEDRWRARFGEERIRSIRECIENLFVARGAERLLLAEGLVPAEGTVRAGNQAPALGRRDVGPAARQRMRDLVAQTEMFIRDPVNALPHYPLWDMNRGFGP
jgi:hypothetical protein